MPNNIASVRKRTWRGLIDLFLSLIFLTVLGSIFGDTYIGGSTAGGFSLSVTGTSFYIGSF